MMRDAWMEVLPPPMDHYASRGNWFMAPRAWTVEENEQFDRALAGLDPRCPDWEKVARAIPGRTVVEVMTHYKDLELDVDLIESGLVPFPVYWDLELKDLEELCKFLELDVHQSANHTSPRRSHSGRPAALQQFDHAVKMSEPKENLGNKESQSIVIVNEVLDSADKEKVQQPESSKNAEKEKEQQQNAEEEEVKESKKRKEMQPRSDAWDSFTKIFEGKVLKKGKCNFCKRELRCETKTNGTSALLKHLKICKSNPNRNTDDKQHTLQATQNEGEGGKSTLTAWRFDPEMLRNAFAEMIITDELPFAFSEKEGFRKFMSKACPRFNVPSRRTITRDTVRTFNREKEKLKKFFKESCERVCLTTDTWTSIQQQSYMCVTAHFIDSNWKLHKKIIGFFLVKGHKGEDIGKDLERCLLDWGIDKVFTITVDNASANEVAINYVKKVMNNAKTSIAKGKYLHMRCAAHIINLIVSDGLREVEISVERVRAAVRFVKNSPTRIARFKKCAELEKVDSKAFLSLDVTTRWNSTYLMLKAAATYEKVFDRYGEEDPYYPHELNGEKGHGVSEAGDWDNVKKMTEFLEHFYNLTLRVSASLHGTSHIFFHEIADVIIFLRERSESDDPLRKDMAKRMIAKYNTYWGNHNSFNILIFVAVALDPRYKLSNYTKIATLEMFGNAQGQEIWNEMSNTLQELFEEYGNLYAPSDKVQPSNEAEEPVARGTSLMKNLITKKMRMNSCGISASKSELEKYLAEENEEDNNKFDILEWWKFNSSRFPVLSRLARDVLAVPISTVASESAFSAGGRILDEFRSSLTPFMVQALICTQDWLRRSVAVNIEEDAAKLAKLEEALLEEIGELNISKSKMGSNEVQIEKMVDTAITFTKISEYIMSFPSKTKLVHIYDMILTRGDLECLLQDGGWLHDNVINAYIYCLRVQEHLCYRAGARVFLDNTYVSAILKRDGELSISPENNPHIVKRALNYLQHDMLFIPVNVPAFHWYLSVVDIKQHQIQVLDSFGSQMSRTDLHLTLKGLEKHLMIAYQMNEFNKGDWPDLHVTTWPVVEHIEEPIQSDGSSCGLFMLQFMEHWTGHDLSQPVTQEGVKLFRQKLAIILFESDLNEIKGTP